MPFAFARPVVPRCCAEKKLTSETQGRREVRVRHIAVGLHFADTYFRSGLYPVQLPFPYTAYEANCTLGYCHTGISWLSSGSGCPAAWRLLALAPSLGQEDRHRKRGASSSVLSERRLTMMHYFDVATLLFLVGTLVFALWRISR